MTQDYVILEILLNTIFIDECEIVGLETFFVLELLKVSYRVYVSILDPPNRS